MIKETFAKAGSLPDYFSYIVILFGWYLVNDLYSTNQFGLSEGISTALNWALLLLASPLVYSVVLGGISERQNTPELLEGASFFDLVKAHFWRLMRANFLYILTAIVVSLVVGLITGSETPNQGDQVVNAVISATLSTVTLFWFSAMVVERKIFRSLFRSLKTLLFHPAVLGIGILWGILCVADSLIFNRTSSQTPLVINLIRSGMFAFLKVLAAMYILYFYKTDWGSRLEQVGKELAADEPPTAIPGEKLGKVGFGFSFVSFLPLMHFVPLVLGLLAIKRSRRITLRTGIACWTGAFFSAVYLIMIVGIFVSRANQNSMPGFTFLTKANSEVESYVTLLEQDAGQEIQAQLGSTAANDPNRHWTFDSALALAEFQNNDLEAALRDFSTALQKQPERSEFYFYYGLALLQDNNESKAAEQFRLALERDPQLIIAERYRTLIQTAYQPPLLVSALMDIVILLILFALHEYGHAFAAWKLGDDTAKNMGRLTLNPLAHLDIFGSILLPAILILTKSDGIFGWAKPVPVNPANFQNPRKDHMLVSFAGPAVNLMISMVCFVVVGVIMLLTRVLWPDTISLNLAAPFSSVSMVGTPLAPGIVVIVVFLKQMLYISLILGIFNLIPVPPLDGSWIFAGILPRVLRNLFERVRQFGFVIFVLLAISPALDYLLSIPLGIAWVGLQVLVSAIGYA